jgi:hypothetical protein
MESGHEKGAFHWRNKTPSRRLFWSGWDLRNTSRWSGWTAAYNTSAFTKSSGKSIKAGSSQVQKRMYEFVAATNVNLFDDWKGKIWDLYYRLSK